jgi:hypothetical protein
MGMEKSGRKLVPNDNVISRSNIAAAVVYTAELYYDALKVSGKGKGELIVIEA